MSNVERYVFALVNGAAVLALLLGGDNIPESVRTETAALVLAGFNALAVLYRLVVPKPAPEPEPTPEPAPVESK